MSTDRLPPFPDRLLDRTKKEQTIGFINGLEMPARLGRGLLQRWGQMTGVELTRFDYQAVSSKPGGRPRPRLEPRTPLTVGDAALELFRAIGRALGLRV